jgi:hypothetical protein
MTNLLQFTINAQKSHHQPQRTWLFLCKDQIQTVLRNHSELITCTYEHSFLTTTNTTTSHSTELPPESPCIYVHGSKKYSTNNSSASPVFFIHGSIAISYHSSHNVMFTFLMNITYLVNYI